MTAPVHHIEMHAEEIRQAMPNGRHIDLVPVHHTARTTRTKEQP